MVPTQVRKEFLVYLFIIIIIIIYILYFNLIFRRNKGEKKGEIKIRLYWLELKHESEYDEAKHNQEIFEISEKYVNFC